MHRGATDALCVKDFYGLCNGDIEHIEVYMSGGSNILFVHQEFPSQFVFIAEELVRRGDNVIAIAGTWADDFIGVDVRRWSLSRNSTPGILDSALKTEYDFILAGAAAEAARRLKSEGFYPDIIVAHPGWGETLFLKEVFPRTPQILLSEFFYRSRGQCLDFDPEFDSENFTAQTLSVTKNATVTLASSFADRIIVPTPFQASGFPPLYAPIIKVHHEGVDFERAKRKPNAEVTLPGGRKLDSSKPVITFINRTFERLRGFHIFMRALPSLLAAVPDVEIILVGSDIGSLYGAEPPDGGTWKGFMLSELREKIDSDRVHFIGHISHERLIDVLSISWGHVYYTYPFALSWSLLEAMGCECLILGSDTAPVRDAVTHGVNGILQDFFDVDGLSRSMIHACQEPEKFHHLRTAARASALAKFDRATVGVPGWIREIDRILAGRSDTTQTF